jgi:hypothetical protein
MIRTSTNTNRNVPGAPVLRKITRRALNHIPLWNFVESRHVIIGLDFVGSRDLGLEQSPRVEGHLNVLLSVPPLAGSRRRRESLSTQTTGTLCDEGYRFLIHDRDRIYSRELDASLKSLAVSVLKTPYKCPQANAFCERLIGSARRECLDFMIPFNEAHVRQILKSWTSHYNKGRPHSSLGPGIPDRSFPKAEVQTGRHSIPKNRRIVVTSILGGLHHEYGLDEIAA